MNPSLVRSPPERVRGIGGWMGATLLLLVACGSGGGSGPEGIPGADGRLNARIESAQQLLEPGLHPLDLGPIRDGALYIPQAAAAGEPLPLLVLLHGAESSWQDLEGFFPIAEELGILLLLPNSRFPTWDRASGPFGADVVYIDRALDFAFMNNAADPARLGIGGFSDGASYALSLGLTNGDLFTHIMSFSPGFISPHSLVGSPLIFISHGTSDAILPVSTTRDQIVPGLIDAGYSVIYREFDGGHTVPGDIAREALEWLRD